MIQRDYVFDFVGVGATLIFFRVISLWLFFYFPTFQEFLLSISLNLRWNLFNPSHLFMPFRCVVTSFFTIFTLLLPHPSHDITLFSLIKMLFAFSSVSQNFSSLVFFYRLRKETHATSRCEHILRPRIHELSVGNGKKTCNMKCNFCILFN